MPSSVELRKLDAAHRSKKAEVLKDHREKEYLEKVEIFLFSF
jgi:hypothetical protein